MKHLLNTLQTLFFWGGMLFTTGLHAQNMEVASATEAPLTPENLVSNYFLGEGVDVIDITFDGDANAVGFFNRGSEYIGIERGIVMTTGYAKSSQPGQGANIGADLPNCETFGAQMEASIPNNSTARDQDIETIAGNSSIQDLARYTIRFRPVADTLKFRYVFASEEYPEFVCAEFNDAFGFFISGPGINGSFENNGENIALIPNTNLPVSINNINSGIPGEQAPDETRCEPPLGSLSFTQYYNENVCGQQPVYDGFTSVLEAQVVLTPCEEYTIKLVIADVADSDRDSGVFLEAKSFGTGSLDVQATTVSLDGTVTEGCSEGELVFTLPTPTESDYTFDYTIFGTAENGVDYEQIPSTLTIPAGQQSTSVTISALEDGIEEGLESIYIDVQLDICNRDTFEVFIRDNQLVLPDFSEEMICVGDSILLDGTLPLEFPPDPHFEWEGSQAIFPEQESIYSPIEVTDILPSTVGPGTIESVCIDSLLHTWIEDVDLYLVAPSGQFMELSTDNGGNGNNSLGEDYYINTCFTPTATDRIRGDNIFAPASDLPFTGEYLPEGEWSDIYGSPSNGTWQLLMVDDKDDGFIFSGILFKWSINFSSAYEVTYNWSPATGLSCTDCPNPVAKPTTTTIYTYTVADSRGCTASKTATVNVPDPLPAPMVNCGEVNDTRIVVNFNEIQNAQGYEVNVNGNGWEPINGDLSHAVDGLTTGDEVTFQVRAISDCGAEIGTVTCSTQNCVEPTITIESQTDISCNGSEDGSIRVSAMGSASDYNFSLLDETNTTGIFSDLPPGTFELIAFDTPDCADTIMVTINETTELDLATEALQESLCGGQGGGSASAIVSGGTYPYFYNWSSGETDSIAVNLDSGTNAVTITDANDCEQIIEVEIAEPSPLVLATEQMDVSCNNDADGLAIVTVVGSDPNQSYIYTWDENANFQNNDTIQNLSPGTYRVTVTSSAGCSQSTSVTIGEPATLQLTTSTSDASCSGIFDGTASVAVMGGSGNYTYAWNNPSQSDTPEANALTVGEYFVVVTDLDGTCQDTAFVMIDSPNAIIVDQQATATSCIETSNGSLNLIISGGVPDYSISWEDEPNNTDAARANLAAGLYQATVSDSNNCFEVVEVLIPTPDSITYEISATQNSCNPEDDGTATILAMGGTGALTYMWNDSAGQTTNRAIGLAPNTYTVSVTDENNCMVMASINVEDAPNIELSIDNTSASCFGSEDATATANATGGIGELAYSWNDTNLQTSQTATGLSAGAYRVTVQDDLGCEAIENVVIEQPQELTATNSVSTTSCDGEPDGNATVNAFGGTAPYTYKWSDENEQTTASATNLAPQTYFVTITDTNNCMVIDTVDVSAPEAITVILNTSDASCGASADGTLTAMASGGSGEYTYQWSDTSFPNAATVDGVPAGEYSVTVTDVNGCDTQALASVQEAAPMTITLDKENISCTNPNSGAINLTITDASEPLTYEWSNSDTTQSLSGLGTGTYEVTITDANGCTATASSTLTDAEQIDLQVETQNISCNGLTNGSIQLMPNGGSGFYIYRWEDGNVEGSRNNLGAGSYPVEVSDSDGCITQDTIVLSEPDSIFLEIIAENISCFGNSDGFILAMADGGSPLYSYNFEGQGFNSRNSFSNLSAGEYQLVARDQNGCNSESQDIIITQPVELSVELGDNTLFEIGDSILLNPKVAGGTGDMTYQWSPQDTSLLSCHDCPNPNVTATFQTSFQVTVIDENGCRDRDAITIFISKDRKVLVPTGFTPNEDGKNDRLFVHGTPDTKVLTFRVFDRWGELVYQQDDFMVNDLSNGWDGSFRNQELPSGVYVWYLEVEYSDGLKELHKGETTLIR